MGASVVETIRRDIIAAIATPPGYGGVGIVRLSGAGAVALAAGLLGVEESKLVDRRFRHGAALDGTGTRIDDVLAVAMRGPGSFTGEDVVEIHGHGGPVNMAQLLAATVARGARHAEPGEFSRRAFENGKLDLVRAEAIADVISASSERALKNAQAQLQGALGSAVRALRERAVAALAEIEACIDFPEEGNDYLEGRGMAGRLAELAADVDALAATYRLGQALREGIDVALIGPVNAGKSSLLNELCGSERAIVDATPGTTRDFVEASAVWSGVAVTLIDTAGEREAVDPVELKGIDLGRRRAQGAHLRLVVRSCEDLAADPVMSALPRSDQADRETVWVASKADLVSSSASLAAAGWLVTSTVSRSGIDALRAEVIARVGAQESEGSDGVVVTSVRQRDLMVRAAQGLATAAAALAALAPVEMAALDVREALARLAEILGEEVGEQVLDALFSQFCIGK